MHVTVRLKFGLIIMKLHSRVRTLYIHVVITQNVWFYNNWNCIFGFLVLHSICLQDVIKNEPSIGEYNH